ncbi:7-cyano-7-deazaguanine synthase [Parvularcula oceani]|uniref:7-cyano-7-deazaguanine synthase n=1 Tax=Parvularcula oceani TaxID=1247963 RepID=UPI0009DE3D66
MRTLLFSGGVESTCLAFSHRPDLLLTLDYGQAPAEGEVQAATALAGKLSLRHRVIRAPLGHLGAGELIGHPSEHLDRSPEHWPLRNQLLITLAAMALHDEGITELLIGTVSTDGVHPDGRPAFLAAMEKTVGTQIPRFRLTAPAVEMTTEELVRRSQAPIDLLRWTFSCHRAPTACGRCRGCQKSIALFERLKRGNQRSSA